MWNWLRQLLGRNGQGRRDRLESWDGIHREATPDDPPRPRWEPGGPPPDYTREDATFRREAERLARDHLGKIVLIHNDDVVGIYDDSSDWSDWDLLGSCGTKKVAVFMSPFS